MSVKVRRLTLKEECYLKTKLDRKTELLLISSARVRGREREIFRLSVYLSSKPINYQNNKFTSMKTKNQKSMTPQVRFTLALNATWSVLHDPVLTKIYVRKWKRQNGLLVTIYGYVFREMYKAV